MFLFHFLLFIFLLIPKIGLANLAQIQFPEEGTRLTLECPVQIKTGERLQFRWYRNVESLSRHSPTFSIPSISRTDSGLYRCFSFTDEFGGVFSPAVNISVQYLDGFIDAEQLERHQKFVPNISFWLRAPQLNAGGNFSKFEWKWSKDGTDIHSDGIRHFVNAKGDLLVLDPNERTSGQYSVQITDGKKTFKSGIFRVEKDSNSNDESTTFGIMQRPEDVKAFDHQLNEAIHFDCVPNWGTKYGIEIRWSINSEEVPETETFVRMEMGKRRLVILNLEGLLGKGTRSAVVSCKAKGITEDGQQFGDQADARLDILEIPHINRELMEEEIVKEEGEMLNIICRANRGWPKPKISWFFNDQMIEGANSDQLIISKLNGQQFGVYQCEMANLAGSDIMPIWVRKKRNSENGLLENVNQKPKTSKYKLIEEGPTNQSILIGSNVQMNCRIGNTLFRPIWFINNERLPDGGDISRRISLDEGGTRLRISQVGPENIGEYRCMAHRQNGGNEEGQGQSGWLSIIEKPGMVQNVRAELVNERNNIAAENGNGSGGGQERIRVNWTQGFDGNSPVVKWVLEMRTMGGPKGIWSDWEESMEMFPGTERPSADCCSTFVENVRPAATAQFRVLAHNRFGAGKPSLPSQEITMPQQPPAAAPSNVRASARSAQSILVNWQPPPETEGGEGGEEGSNIRGYLVRYRLSGYSTADWNERKIADGKARRELIEPLITWREYDIQVAAFNDRGLGVFSKPVTISTNEGVPMQSPQNVQILVLNSTAILVTFDPPNPQMVPGVNLGYKIQLWRRSPEGNGQKLLLTEQILHSMGRIQKEIGNLAKFTEYNATVLCFTAAGDGPSSEPVEFRTAEDFPGPVEVLEIVEVFSESAIIKWELPKEANGEIQKYKLEWWEMNSEMEGKNIGRMEISGHSQNQTLEGLEAQTKYKIAIQAFTRIGPGPKAEATFESGVPPELPERPSGLSISEVVARKARLHFMPGSDGHARIKKWIVEAKIGHSSIFTQFAEFTSLPRGTNSILIESFTPNTQYQLRLIAENVRGRSVPSEPTAAFQTQQAAPEHSPHRLWADPISGGQISVIWTPLLDAEWNGNEPRAYLLQYRGFSLANPIDWGNGSLEAAFNQLKWEEIRIIGAKQHQHLLSGLRPFSLYELRILAANGMGQSEVNNAIQVWTYEAIPSAAPQFVRTELTSQGGIMAEWNELEPEMTNGQIIGYKVILADEQNEGMGEAATILSEMEMPATHRTVQFPPTLLRPNTAYSLTVQAETIIGPGPKQELAKMLKTPEDAPDPPSNATFIYKSLSELQLGWSHPQRPKGRILHYGVLYWPLSEHRPAIPFTEIPSNLAKFSATHLRPNSAYEFSLKAQSSAGWGPERVFTVKTNTQSIPLPVPPVPIRDTSKPQSATELHLIWTSSAVNADDSPPRSIELQWQMANEDGWNGLVEYISASTKNYTLTRLRPNSAYRVRIRFIGDLAHSVWSSPSDWLRTMEAAPFHAPSNVQLEPFDSNKLRVQWKSLPKEEWNADRIGYRVQYRIYQPFSATFPSNSTFAIEELPLAEHFPENIQIELNGLQSFRHYLVQVHAFNVLGQSPPSRPPQFILIGHLKPTKRVHNLRTDSLSSTSIRVHWDILEGNSPNSEANANNGGYRIRWTQIMDNNGGEDGVEELTMTEQNEHILTDLRKWSQYRIAVSGFNRAGEGPLATVIGRTLEDLPGPVGQIQFRDILLDSVKVRWTRPIEINGNLTGYVLLYRTSRQRNGERPLHLEKIFPKKEVQFRTVDTELSLDQLEANVTYFVSVRAETAAGLGPERSAEVTIGPNANGPEAPGRPQLIPEHREVKIRWQSGPEGNDPIIGYLVQAKRIGTALVQNEEKSRNKRQLDQSTEGRKWPRHLIGHWNTIGQTNSNTANEWHIPYRELEPSSFYVFRVFARNELGIGRPSADSEQFHVPATIPDEPFYTEWWFLTLVGAVLAFTILGFVALLFLAGNRKETVNAAEMIGQKRKKNKKERRGKEAAAFDTLQLSDGGIVSYELYTKRGERGDEMLFSRPNTKQSWVGSIRNSPAISSNRSNGGAICGIYGSIDGGVDTGRNGKAQMPVAQLPNVYSALCTDSIAILAQNEGNGRESAQNGGSGDHSTIHSPPYYQLRQFNTNTQNNNNNGIYYDGGGFKEDGGLPLMMGPIGGDQMDTGGENLVSHYQHQQSERRTTWRKTREKAQREQWQKQQQGIPLSGNIRSRTPTTLFRPDENCWMAQRRSRSSEPSSELAIDEQQNEREMETDFDGIPTTFNALPFQTPNNGQLPSSQSQRSSNELAGLSSFV